MECAEIKVLLVEDSPTDIRLLQEELSQVWEYAFDITTKDNLEKAIEAACGTRYDIVLLDLNLPDSSGLDTITRFARECPQAPIIILTGMEEQISGVEAIHLGAQDYLVKGTHDSGGIARAIRYAIERWRLTGALQNALREKELLMKEIHHRVKNNLTIISSLLNLQFDLVSDVNARRILEESDHRIISMQIIYDKLYRSDNLASMSIKDYLPDLISSLFKTYNTHSEHINLELDIQDLNFEIGKIVSCGLIINELVSNSLKYAFPDSRPGNVRVTVRRDVDHNPDNTVGMLVSDNGVGIPDTVNIHAPSSFGLKLVGLLVKQLNGSMAIDMDHGTTFRISFAI